MKKIMVSMSKEMVKALQLERKARKLESVPETVRAVLGEYFKTSADGRSQLSPALRRSGPTLREEDVGHADQRAQHHKEYAERRGDNGHLHLRSDDEVPRSGVV